MPKRKKHQLDLRQKTKPIAKLRVQDKHVLVYIRRNQEGMAYQERLENRVRPLLRTPYLRNQHRFCEEAEIMLNRRDVILLNQGELQSSLHLHLCKT
ncbi:hypothetical protein M514_01987 [Trichuris suis]|uniref:Uncharacterized protein n=1 Tax=Trichuris suis TaxID=68888 RepID=A0A085NJH6_9BILA|nr:hypothetical protein M513_01987 [Trichuris suis]KFD69622.1 hypothetical protein M514_01987 [Trichuris suis]